MKDIMNDFHLADNQCIVALASNGSGWILAMSEEYSDKDVLPEISTEDNGFNGDWDKGLSVGVYLCTLKPWAYKDEMTGEYDCGVDVVKVEPLWALGQAMIPLTDLLAARAEERERCAKIVGECRMKLLPEHIDIYGTAFNDAIEKSIIAIRNAGGE